MSWIERATSSDRSTSERHGSLVVSGPERALASAIEELIASAPHDGVLRVMSPVIDDERIVAALIAARARGVEIRVCTALLDRQRIVTKGWDGEGSVEAHAECIRRLAMAGVLLRSTSSTPHGKLLLVDGVRGAIGSANLATGSLRRGALEALVYLDDPALLAALRGAFDAVWRTCSFKMMFLGGSTTISEAAPARQLAAPDGTWRVGDGRVLISMPGGPPSIASPGAEWIEAAQSRVLFVALSFYRLDEVPRIGEAIVAALRRGVRVQALVRPEHFKPSQFPEPNTRKLIDLGLELRGFSGLHAKGFVVDDQWCGIHSANFNPYSLDTRLPEANVEIALVDRVASSALGEYADWLARIWDRATHEWRE